MSHTDKLCQVLYGREPKASDYLGGADANMIYDAAKRIKQVERLLQRWKGAYDKESADLAVQLASDTGLALKFTKIARPTSDHIYKETFTVEEVSDMFWDCLKRDPEHKDRRMTAWGTKTKLGLALTIKRLGDGLSFDDEERRAYTDTDENGQ